MLKFLKKVKTVNSSFAGPIVVHCRYFILEMQSFRHISTVVLYIVT